MSEENQEKSSDQKLLSQVREHFRLSEEASKEIRDKALEDLEFRAGKQWLEELENDRTIDGRPCIVINKMPQFVRQITNDQKLNRSAIKISPIDDKADVDTAKILQGMIKHIENQSSADMAYDLAFEGAVTKGFGFFRILTEYCDELSFNQEIRIKGIDNDFSVYFDPNAKELDGSDASFAIVFDELSQEEFKSLYPSAELSSMADWTSVGDTVDNWVTEKKCRVAEYYYREFREAQLVLLQDGTVLEKDKLPVELTSLIVKERSAQIPEVKWIKTNGMEILEKTDWPCKWIPIIPVYGERLNINGEVVLESVIRHAKDPQRMYNYWASTESETIALAPRAPFIAAEGQIPEQFEHIWKTANRKNHAYLPYSPTSHEGHLVGAPQRNAYEAPIGAISQARMQSNDDIKATTGIYDASLGNRSNEQSGVAIQRRTIQAQTSNYHFVSNLNAAKRHAGRILVDLIPKIYDTAQAIRIIGEDNSEEIVKINQVFEKNGEQIQYNLGFGKYDVAIETGPSFATKRQEAAAAQTEMVKAFPQLASIAGDIIIGNMDWPGAKEIQARVKKTLPPGILDEKQSSQIPPDVQAKMGQMEQMIQQLSGSLEQASQAIREKRIELESRERIEFAKINAQLEIEKAKIESKEALEGFASSMSTLEDDIILMKNRLGLLNFSEPISNESGGQSAVIQQNQSPTGGIYSPGKPMG